MASKQHLQEHQTIKPSRTMPQLHYTRQDIHEQYLIQQVSSCSKTQESSANSASKERTRAKSSDPSRQRLASSAEESAASSEFDSSLAETRFEGQLGAKRKRRRRAQSASLFSACFTIPSQLGAKLISQTHSSQAGQSGRRSLLAHLGLAGQSQPGQQQQQTADRPSQQPMRPISNSRTTGDLRSIAPHQDTSDVGQTGRSSRRDELASWKPKHVSFGANEQRQQKQPQASLPASISSAGPTASGSQILRNYQPRLTLAAESALTMQPRSGKFFPKAIRARPVDSL